MDTLYFNCLGVPQVEWKTNEIKYTKPGEYTKHFEKFNLVVFYKQRCHHEEISEKNDIQTIHGITVAGFACSA